MRKDQTVILFWGSLWGITEATLGFVLHLFSMALPGLPGLLMFPIAFIFMNKVYDSTHDPKSILHIAVIAALIKLTDLAFGGIIPIYIINPALSLLMEGGAVAIVYTSIIHHNRSIRLRESFLMGILWRGIFLGYMWVISKYSLPAGLVTNGWGVILRFLVLESFFNALLIQGYLAVSVRIKSFDPKPILAWGLLIVAVALQRVM